MGPCSECGGDGWICDPMRDRDDLVERDFALSDFALSDFAQSVNENASYDGEERFSNALDPEVSRFSIS
jgi:hypothetical protein